MSRANNGYYTLNVRSRGKQLVLFSQESWCFPRRIRSRGKHQDSRENKTNWFSEGPDINTLFTWSGGPRSSGVSFFCFVPLRAWKQKKPTPLDRGPPLHVNRVLLLKLVKKGGVLDNKASQQDKKKIPLLLPYSEALWVIKFGYPCIQQILVVKKSSVRTYILFMVVNVNCHTY